MKRMTPTLLATAAAVLLFLATSAGAANLTVVSPGLDASQTSAQCPTGCKLAVNMTSDTTMAFVISQEPVGETTFRADFWIFHNNIVLPTAPVKTIRIIELRKDAPAARILAFAAIYFRDGRHKINFMAHNDDNSVRPVGGYVLGLSGPNKFTLEWQAASAPGANDGLVRVTKGAEVKQITDYNYYNGGTGVDQVRFGVVKPPEASINGTFFLDSYSSFRTLAP